MVKDLLKANSTHLQLLWNDTVTVKRHVEYKKPNKATASKLEDVHIDIKCHYSQKTTSTNQTIANNVIQYTHTLFYSSDIEIQAGDEICVNVKGSGVMRMFKRASEPILYFSHNSVQMERVDSA
jgi:hypothetical protein